MKSNKVSAPELWALYQKHGDRCQDVKPWSLVLDDEKYVVPVSDRAGAPLIKGAYQQTNNKAHRKFANKDDVVAGVRYYSAKHKAMLVEYATKNDCTEREAVERAIELLANHTT